VGEGFPAVLQEQLSWSSSLVQSDDGKICGATLMDVEKTDGL